MEPTLIPPVDTSATLPLDHQGRRRNRLPLRLLWVVVSLFALGIFLASIPAYHAYLESICRMSACPPGQLSQAQAHQLSGIGVTLPEYAILLVALAALSGACWCAVAAILFLRGPGTLMTLFAALTLVTFGLGRFPDAPTALAAADPAWWLPVAGIRYLGSACLSCFCYVFPDGKFIPRWTRLAALLWIIPQIPEFFWPASPLNPNSYPPLLQAAGFLGFVASVVVAQTYRYWQVSSMAERQQTKWAIFGMAVALTGFLILVFVLPVLLSGSGGSLPGSPYIQAATYGVMLLVPLSLGVAILRHQLYDIDLLINRTLVYGSLTGILSLIYFSLVIGLQSLIAAHNHTTSQSPLIIVASTLLIAALFRPLRQWIQIAIDRRFYRSKYDASKILEHFASGLQNEVDLRNITDHLLSVVEDTMQPVQISLWVRKSEPEEQRASPRGQAPPL
jgi:hypothetical protein